MTFLLTLLACEPNTTIIENYIESCCCDDDDTTDTGDTGEPEPSPCEGFEAPEPDEVDTIEDCIAEPDPIEFAPEVEWAWAPTDTDHPYNQVMVTPVAGNLTDDNSDGVIDTSDMPDVAFTAYRGSAYHDGAGALVVVSGDDGSELYYHTTLTHDGTSYIPQSRGGLALGDIDNDGIPEICLPTRTAPLVCTHADGTVVMVGAVPSGVSRNEWASGYPSIGDMDGDGSPEIAIGRVIWDSTGALVATGASSHGGYVLTTGAWYSAASVMSDIDGDGDLELLAGDTAYERDGTPLWISAGADNGLSAVGDLDLDGDPDVVTAADGTAYIIDSAGNLTTSFALVGCLSGNTCGPPTIADFDADGAPEIGIAGVSSYTVYDDDQTGSWTPLWSEDIVDGSGATGAVVFDFEADGEAEVVFADEGRMYIWGGSDGSDRLGLAGWDPTEHGSGTGLESPSLADLDNDGSTEILIASNELFSSGWHGVRALGNGDGAPWAPSRPVWNQHSYHITNINDDLSVPTAESANWLTHNNFRTQDQGERPGSWLADLRISAVDFCVDCDAETTTFYVVVENQGLGSSGPADMVISTDVGAVVTEGVDLDPQESIVLGPYLVSHGDWVGSLQVDIDPGDDVDECDEYNNDWVVGMLPCEG